MNRSAVSGSSEKKKRVYLDVLQGVGATAILLGLGLWLGLTLFESPVGPGVGAVLGYLLGLMNVYRLVERRS